MNTHYNKSLKIGNLDSFQHFADSGMTERSKGDKDLFNKQGLLGGERVPILFGAGPGNLETETGNNLWYGDRMNGDGIMPLTKSLEQVETLPIATQYQLCERTEKELCQQRIKYHDSCWEPRSDFKPQETQNPHAGSQVSWHPGDREHQFNSRKTILLFLDALDKAFAVWEEGIDKDGFPLKESYWHLGDEYKQFRNNLTSYLNGPGLGESECEKRWSKLPGLDKVCRMSMSGMTEFTPVNLGAVNSIAAHVKSAPNGYNPGSRHTEPAYSGIDILPLEWKLPEDQIDLHAIAIATTYEPPELDHSIWHNDSSDDEDAEDSRRMLRMVDKGNTYLVEPSDNDEDAMMIPTNDSETRLLDAVTPGLGWERDRGALKITGYCEYCQIQLFISL